ncbi:MAG TPA: hypothetical protein VFR87_13120 [Nocardioidaceae bacterium]|nr:hypothetical protein [Nocardioidaceae bacterium]
MSAASYLAYWVTRDRPPAAAPVATRPRVPRQRTWTEGRWRAYFHSDQAVSIPRQRVPLHDRKGSDTPALV